MYYGNNDTLTNTILPPLSLLNDVKVKEKQDDRSTYGIKDIHNDYSSILEIINNNFKNLYLFCKIL